MQRCANAFSQFEVDILAVYCPGIVLARLQQQHHKKKPSDGGALKRIAG